MMRRFVCIIFVLVLLTGCFSACTPSRSAFAGQETTPGDVLFQSEDVSVTQVNPAAWVAADSVLYAPMTEEMAYGKNQVIVEGVASNLRFATVEYVYSGSPKSRGITLFDFTVSNVLLGDKAIKNTTVVVGIDYNGENYSAGHPVLKQGGEYLMFCQIPGSDPRDPMGKEGYSDLWAGYAKDLILEKVGDDYLATEYLASYSDSALSLREVTEGAEKRSPATVSSVSGIALERTNDGKAEYSIFLNEGHLIPCDEVREIIRETLQRRKG